MLRAVMQESLLRPSGRIDGGPVKRAESQTLSLNQPEPG